MDYKRVRWIDGFAWETLALQGTPRGEMAVVCSGWWGRNKRSDFSG